MRRTRSDHGVRGWAAGVAACAMLLPAVLAGCGSDDEEDSTAAAPPATTAPEEPTEPNHEVAPPAEPSEPERGEEDEPSPPAGGSAPGDRPPDGGSEPVRAEALLTGRGGRITPRLVRVPPYVAVRVVLRAADARAYELLVDGRRVRVSGRGDSRGLDLAALQPGARYAATAPGGGRVVIEASAEPGP